MSNDFDDIYERREAGGPLYYRDTSGDKDKGRSDTDVMSWVIFAIILIAVLFVWNSADGDGTDTTVHCVAPATNCG